MSNRVIAKQLAFRILEWLGTGLVLFIVLERFNQGGIGALKQWISNYPHFSLYNLLILLLCYGFVRLFFAKAFLSATVYSSIVFLIGTVQYLKLLLKGEPLLPMDIYNIKTAAQIAPNMNIQLGRGFWLNLCFILIWLAIIWLYQRKFWQPLPWRRIFFLVPVFIILALSINYLNNSDNRYRLGIIDIRYNQILNYKQNGFAVASLTNISGAKIKAPIGYEEAYFHNLLKSINPNSTNLEESTRPNIIVLQMEAFSDPRLWDSEIKIEPDPFSPLDKHRSGMQPLKVLTGVLGGSTATTEFEFLTGYNMTHAPQGIMPFVQYMNKQRPSLVWDLRKMGYRTTGIHPNIGSFYARNVAYSNLGFETFIDINGFTDPGYVGYYVSDQSVLNLLKETIGSKDKGKPLFCFTVTIQNHGPYSLPELNREYQVTEGSIPLEEVQIQELRNFSANILDSSLMLAELLDYLQEQEEPYLVLAYGDHHANWNWGNQLTSGLEQVSRKYLTEGFFWANYPVEYEKRQIISANYLSPYLFKYADIPMPIYYQVLYDQAQDILGYNPFFIIDKNGSIIPHRDQDTQINGLVQYDRLFGNQYLDKINADDS